MEQYAPIIIYGIWPSLNQVSNSTSKANEHFFPIRPNCGILLFIHFYLTFSQLDRGRLNPTHQRTALKDPRIVAIHIAAMLFTFHITLPTVKLFAT